MKDVVVDKIHLGLVKEVRADRIRLISGVLGSAVKKFLRLAAVIGLETIVECCTYNEVQAALIVLTQNMMVSNCNQIRYG